MTDDLRRDVDPENDWQEPESEDEQTIEITEVEGLPADAPPPGLRGSPGDEEEDTETEVMAGTAEAEKAAALEALQEDLLRVRAEFDNYRKRQKRERTDLARHATAKLVEQLLPVIDNFRRAMADRGEGQQSGFRQGVEMIYKQLMEVLEREGLQPLDSRGQEFDPNFHEAMARVETDAVEANTVVDELEPGYMFRDRLLKPARVRVAVPPKVK